MRTSPAYKAILVVALVLQCQGTPVRAAHKQARPVKPPTTAAEQLLNAAASGSKTHTYSNCAAAPYALNQQKPGTDEPEPEVKPTKGIIHLTPTDDLTPHPFKFPPSIYDNPRHLRLFKPKSDQVFWEVPATRTPIMCGRGACFAPNPAMPAFFGLTRSHR